MKKEPILVVLAAGMGSRYGGLKQIDSVGVSGECIMDYSIYDAIRAGFKRVIFIINKNIKEDFIEIIGKPLANHIDITYCYQELEDVPKGLEIPEGREKPWGTSHAIYAAREAIDAPFMIINADDFYGQEAYQKMYKFLKETQDQEDAYSMVAYQLEKTITDKGSVARGICKVNEDGYLDAIVERTQIKEIDGKIKYMEDDKWHEIEDNAVVSMNMFGFKQSILKHIEDHLLNVLSEEIKTNPLKAEFFVPTIVDILIKSGKASVKVLTTDAKWYGVTYKEDKQLVVDAIADMVKKGQYPSKLW